VGAAIRDRRLSRADAAKLVRHELAEVANARLPARDRLPHDQLPPLADLSALAEDLGTSATARAARAETSLAVAWDVLGTDEPAGVDEVVQRWFLAALAARYAREDAAGLADFHERLAELAAAVEALTERMWVRLGQWAAHAADLPTATDRLDALLEMAEPLIIADQSVIPDGEPGLSLIDTQLNVLTVLANLLPPTTAREGLLPREAALLLGVEKMVSRTFALHVQRGQRDQARLTAKVVERLGAGDGWTDVDQLIDELMTDGVGLVLAADKSDRLVLTKTDLVALTPPGLQVEETRDASSAPVDGVELVGADGRRYRVGRKQMLLGSHHGADVQLTDPTVTELHAVLQRRADGWLIANLATPGQVRVNGRQVHTLARLRPGDRIKLGQARFRFHAPSEPGRFTRWIRRWVHRLARRLTGRLIGPNGGAAVAGSGAPGAVSTPEEGGAGLEGSSGAVEFRAARPESGWFDAEPRAPPLRRIWDALTGRALPGWAVAAVAVVGVALVGVGVVLAVRHGVAP
ncbi:MAG: FHA domain-containing protein, partial [Pseudonocardia sp.]|nr:FHA domain-containing protein [Pseudonocardia sp.]